MAATNIALILDSGFGERVIEIAKTMPVWIVQSEINDSAVRKARSLLQTISNITSVLVKDGEPLDNICSRTIYNMDEHHGIESGLMPYCKILVFGADPAILMPEIMSDIGFSSVDKTDFGFTLTKTR